MSIRVGIVDGGFGADSSRASDFALAVRRACASAEVLAVDVPSTHGRVSASGLADGIKRAIEKGCEVVAVPLTTSQKTGFDDVLREADQQGVIVVAAATAQRAAYPAAHANVLAVLGTTGDRITWSASSMRFLVPGRLEGVSTTGAGMATARFAGHVAALRQAHASTPTAAIVETLIRGESAATVPEHRRGLAEALPHDFPHPGLATARFEVQCELVCRWSMRLAQPLLQVAGTPLHLLQEIRDHRHTAMVNNPGGWFDQAPRLLAEIRHPHTAPIVAAIREVVQGLQSGAQHPLGRFSVRCQRLIQHPTELELQRSELGVQLRRFTVYTVSPERMMRWLRHLNDQLEPRSPALEAFLRKQTFTEPPPLPDRACAATRQLHTWIDLLRHAPDDEDLRIRIGMHMAEQQGSTTLLGTPAAPLTAGDARLATLPSEILPTLLDTDFDTAGPLDWMSLDPLLDRWARRLVEGACLESRAPELQHLLKTWDLGERNAMAARWPTSNGLVEPVAVPWVRAERALRCRSDLASSIAWFGLFELVQGGLHGDQDRRWIGRLLGAATHLPTGLDADRERAALAEVISSEA